MVGPHRRLVNTRVCLDQPGPLRHAGAAELQASLGSSSADAAGPARIAPHCSQEIVSLDPRLPSRGEGIREISSPSRTSNPRMNTS
jgi:hypothetical protein